MYTRPLSVSLLRTSKVDIVGTKLVAVGRKSVVNWAAITSREMTLIFIQAETVDEKKTSIDIAVEIGWFQHIGCLNDWNMYNG